MTVRSRLTVVLLALILPVGVAEEAKAGRARGFVEPRADNSIPTFGGEASRRQRSAAQAALGTYLAARAEGRWRAACGGLASSVRSQLETMGGGRGCPDAYASFASGHSRSARADPLASSLLSLRAKGSNAVALWIGPGRQKYVMPMTRQGSRWLPIQLAPIPYPLGSQGTGP